MLNEPTLDKLRGLRLGTLADTWLEQQGNADVQALGFDERLAMWVDAEWLDRQNKKLARNLREAKLRLGQASVEDIDYPAKRKLEKTVIRQLATCNWVEAHQNVIITGATGVGKTFVACALAQQACRQGLPGTLSARTAALQRAGPGPRRRNLPALPRQVGSDRRPDLG